MILAPANMILLALGSSVPFSGKAPRDIITSALRALGKFSQIRAVSRQYFSPAWPNPADPPFMNAVARIETGLAPEALLAALHAVEAGFGRRRTRPNGPRTLDIDLLDYKGRRREADARSPLVLPHPAIAKRDFVLLPLAEVAPGWRHPETGASLASLVSALEAPSARPLEGPP
jgi:2-amino-4-hydroxy-6-hydroxymethyldihydropteridine diphosphokinase